MGERRRRTKRRRRRKRRRKKKKNKKKRLQLLSLLMQTTFWTHFFSNVEVHINNQQICNSHGFWAQKSYLSNNFRRAISEYKVVLHCKEFDHQECPDENMDSPLSEPSVTRRLKLLSRPDGLIFYGKPGVDFLCTSELLHPNMKFRLRLIRARSNLYVNSENPKVSLSRMVITRKEGICLHIIAWKLTWRLRQRCFSSVPDKTSLFRKSILTMLQLVVLPFQWTQTCIHCIFYWRSILVSEIQSQTNQNTQRRAVSHRLWCCW